MYESPITLYTLEPKIDIKEELAFFEQKYKLVINEEELLAALKYDRNQYAKGYYDGYEAAREEFENNV